MLEYNPPRSVNEKGLDGAPSSVSAVAARVLGSTVSENVSVRTPELMLSAKWLSEGGVVFGVYVATALPLTAFTGFALIS